MTKIMTNCDKLWQILQDVGLKYIVLMYSMINALALFNSEPVSAKKMDANNFWTADEHSLF